MMINLVNKVISRLKSPVVIIQLLSIFTSVVVTLMPEFSTRVEYIMYIITLVISVVSGINNPADSNNF